MNTTGQSRDLPFKFTDKELNEQSITVPFSRTMSKTDRQLPYRETNMYKKLTLHHGQRKLLLSELEFLVGHGSKSKLVVYPGAAPGSHIVYLAKMFPQHRFLLYDPRPFDPRLQRVSSVRCINSYFTDETAKEVRDKYYNTCGYLFICDIRSFVDNDISSITDDSIYNDLQMQKKWVEIMEPKMSLLKFRLPYNWEKMDYFKGEIYYQIWGPLSTTETRMVTDGKETTTYYGKQYEDIMYRFNNITRQEVYDHEVRLRDVPGIDYCYDCKAEIEVIKKYLAMKGTSKPIHEVMNDITKVVKRPLNRSYHGLVLAKDKSIQDRLLML
jgi:hypothetical protein